MSTLMTLVFAFFMYSGTPKLALHAFVLVIFSLICELDIFWVYGRLIPLGAKTLPRNVTIMAHL